MTLCTSLAGLRISDEAPTIKPSHGPPHNHRGFGVVIYTSQSGKAYSVSLFAHGPGFKAEATFAICQSPMVVHVELRAPGSVPVRLGIRSRSWLQSRGHLRDLPQPGRHIDDHDGRHALDQMWVRVMPKVLHPRTGEWLFEVRREQPLQ